MTNDFVSLHADLYFHTWSHACDVCVLVIPCSFMKKTAVLGRLKALASDKCQSQHS